MKEKLINGFLFFILVFFYIGIFTACAMTVFSYYQPHRLTATPDDNHIRFTSDSSLITSEEKILSLKGSVGFDLYQGGFSKSATKEGSDYYIRDFKFTPGWWKVTRNVEIVTTIPTPVTLKVDLIYAVLYTIIELIMMIVLLFLFIALFQSVSNISAPKEKKINEK